MKFDMCKHMFKCMWVSVGPCLFVYVCDCQQYFGYDSL